MASVTLHEAELRDAGRLSDGVSTYGFGGLSETDESDAVVEHFSRGRTRMSFSDTEPWSVQLTFPAADRTTVQWLRDHKKTLLLYRDPFGRLEWGFYPSVSVPERGSGADPHVSVTFHRVTHSEAV